MSDSRGDTRQTSTGRAAGSTTVSDTTSGGPVVVLGMHRSGTSLTAHILGDLGWYLGRPEELLGPREDNPDGFFERADVQVLNDRILSQVGASWDGPPGPDELLGLGDEVDEHVAALIASMGKDAGASPFALKDPRLCVLWPLWERQLPPSARLVLTFRHPAEVAASLQRRDGMPLVTGLALWEEYVRRALAAAEDRGAVVVRYGDLLEHPDEVIESLAEALGTTVPPDRPKAVRPELYRNRSTVEVVPLTASQRELWSWIEQVPRSVDRIDPGDVPGNQSESSTELVRGRRHAATLQAEVGLLRRSLAESESELKRHAEQNSALDKALHQSRQATAEALRLEQTLRGSRDANAEALRAATIELAVLRDRVRHHEAVRTRQEAEIERDSARLIALVEERKPLDEHVEALRVRRLEQTRRIEALESETQEAQAHLERSRSELAAALADNDSLAQVSRARERVLRFEREQLLRAVSVLEAQRRAEEAAGRAMRASRTWRWGRKLARPLGRDSTRDEET
ncbi:sulfotransferase [Nocardioides sp. T2.26MG-1]|uniref:sulfotransferase n=1 Tax=Nocardioides sp. T2.26MG-1 TaxID=3041166 RepID=UPI00247792D3|nr:sulfotransferase [Nocardioides sp. T2.26MG-1]CAI9403294.1 Chromosome partition protein Smc [Nocardioides sp. T2.26MG-1]